MPPAVLKDDILASAAPKAIIMRLQPAMIYFTPAALKDDMLCASACNDNLLCACRDPA